MTAHQLRHHGSSPHTRGARGASGARIVRGGIIPAYAGSTTFLFSYPQKPWDHPRIRGEHQKLCLLPVVAQGSSPHTRGARRVIRRRRPPSRIIPAYAGSTRQSRTDIALLQDHPRIRGEHEARPGRGSFVEGSSPHTRGAPGSSSPARRRRGIIPAYAGSTRRLSLSLSLSWDHPRIRGEHDSRTNKVVILFWIIPAYAGSTCSG